MVDVLALPHHRVPSLGRAVEQFLAAKALSANGRCNYTHTLEAVVGDPGADLALNVENLNLGVRRAVEGQRRPPPRSCVGFGNRLPSCPATWAAGRGRLSHQQAWALFRNMSGWTLHQLRHSALTHLGRGE